MELDPHINPSMPIGKLICEGGDNFGIEVTPKESRIHIFEDNSHPRIEILNYETQDSDYYVIPTTGVLDEVSSLGVETLVHKTDEEFRLRTIENIALNSEENRFYEWDFWPEEALKDIHQFLTGEIKAPTFTIDTRDGERELRKDKVALVSITDKPLLSHVVVQNEDKSNSCYPLNEETFDYLREAGFTHMRLESSCMPDRVQEDLIKQIINLSDVENP